MTCCAAASPSSCHSAWFFTSPVPVCHPLVFHFGSHHVMPLERYSELVYAVTWQRCLSARRPAIAALNSIRFSDVFGSEPNMSAATLLHRSRHAQPPGPDLPPLQVP